MHSSSEAAVQSESKLASDVAGVGHFPLMCPLRAAYVEYYMNLSSWIVSNLNIKNIKNNIEKGSLQLQPFNRHTWDTETNKYWTFLLDKWI